MNEVDDLSVLKQLQAIHESLLSIEDTLSGVDNISSYDAAANSVSALEIIDDKLTELIKQIEQSHDHDSECSADLPLHRIEPVISKITDAEIINSLLYDICQKNKERSSCCSAHKMIGESLNSAKNLLKDVGL